MIGKVLRGDRAAGLMSYLVSEGRFNEHIDPHMVAGSPIALQWYSTDTLDHEASVRIGAMIDAPHKDYDVDVLSQVRAWDDGRGGYINMGSKNQHVYHVVLSAAPEDGVLTDGQWEQIATTVMDRLGFTEADGRAEAPWVAVNHGAGQSGQDHVHIVASLVREDGTRVDRKNDFKYLSAACARVEREHGLEVVAGRNDAARLASYTHAERGKARREAREMDRTQLERTVRKCAAIATSEDEFVRRVRGSGALIRPRFAAGSRKHIEGYSVALRPPNKGMKAVWFGGGKLSKDLTLSRLRDKFIENPKGDPAGEEWRAAAHHKPMVYRGRERAKVHHEQVAQLDNKAAAWSRYLSGIPTDDRAEWARVAAQTSGALHALADRIRDPDMRRLAEQVSRSAVPPRGERVKATDSTAGLTSFAVIAAQSSKAIKPPVAWALLLTQLSKTVKAFAAANEAAGRRREADQLRAQLQTTIEGVRGRYPEAFEPEFTVEAKREAQTIRAETSRASMWETRPGRQRRRPATRARPEMAGARPDPRRYTHPRRPRRRDNDYGR